VISAAAVVMAIVLSTCAFILRTLLDAVLVPCTVRLLLSIIMPMESALNVKVTSPLFANIFTAEESLLREILPLPEVPVMDPPLIVPRISAAAVVTTESRSAETLTVI
jgi:hypothetical protein